MQIFYAFLYFEILISIALYIFQIYLAFKVNKRVNLVLDSISKSIPKNKITFLDFIAAIPMSIIPIFNFWFFTIMCFYMDKLIEESERELVRIKVDKYSEQCKKRRDDLKNLIDIIKRNKE